MRWLILLVLVSAVQALAQDRPTAGAVLEATSATDWRRPDQSNLLYVQLEAGRIVIELAPTFAPRHVANIRELAGARYYDGLAIVRAQDNYVVQWGDPDAGNERARSTGSAAAMLEPEFDRVAEGAGLDSIDSADAYADQVGFSQGFPAATDGKRTWLIHCYGVLGVGRANSPRSGNGAELYVVTGHAPRHLDRNVSLVGRVIDGIEHLSTLPRGHGPLGFYESAAERTGIQTIRFGNDLPPDERLQVEVLRTDTRAFEMLVEARRYRAEAWFVEPTGRIEICNVPVPVRPVK